MKLRISIEIVSKYRSLLGIFYQSGIEILEGKEVQFSELSFGAIFIMIRFCIYESSNNAK